MDAATYYIRGGGSYEHRTKDYKVDRVLQFNIDRIMPGI